MSKKTPKKPTTQSRMLRFLTPKGAANEDRPSKMLIVEYSDSDSEQENNLTLRGKLMSDDDL